MGPLGTFAITLGVFHLSEFLLTCLFNRTELSRQSWLVSRPYCLAMGLAVLEYLVVSRIGVGMVVLGEVIRKAAMVTAGHSFTHMLKFEKRQEHVLVTDGIYRYIRHPGYLGWLIWAIGTQLILVNPLCAAGFICTSWKFFSERIRIEEAQLEEFFGTAYTSYARRTATWIPFIP
eukprot:jgi/Astpho2/2489/Aster-04210